MLCECWKNCETLRYDFDSLNPAVVQVTGLCQVKMRNVKRLSKRGSSVSRDSSRNDLHSCFADPSFSQAMLGFYFENSVCRHRVDRINLIGMLGWLARCTSSFCSENVPSDASSIHQSGFAYRFQRNRRLLSVKEYSRKQGWLESFVIYKQPVHSGVT